MKNQRYTSLSLLFKVFDQIQKGVVLSRYNYCKDRFDKNYIEIFSQKDKRILNLLDFTFPDRLFYQFNLIEELYYEQEPQVAPPPPIIEEISVKI